MDFKKAAIYNQKHIQYAKKKHSGKAKQSTPAIALRSVQLAESLQPADRVHAGLTAKDYSALLTNGAAVLTSFEAAFVKPFLHIIQEPRPQLSAAEIVQKFEAWRIGKKKFQPHQLASKIDHARSYPEVGNCVYDKWYANKEEWDASSSGATYILYSVCKQDCVFRWHDRPPSIWDAAHALGRPVKNRSAYRVEYEYPSFTLHSFVMAARWLDSVVDFDAAGSIGTMQFYTWFVERIQPLLKEDTDTVL